MQGFAHRGLVLRVERAIAGVALLVLVIEPAHKKGQ
jgi:precorrin-3B methylase